MLNRPSRVLPGFTLSLGLSVFYLCLIVLLPAATLALQASSMTLKEFWFAVTDPRLISAYKITFGAAAIAASLNAAFGLLMAWILVRYEFIGRRLIDSLIDLPFALPTSVAGLTLAALFAQNGWIGQWFDHADIKISYTFYGIIVAMFFTSIPFVVRAVQPVLEDLSEEFEEAAASLGATKPQIFFRIVLPHIGPALTIGTALSFVRSLGEFGAVIFIAGNMPFATEVVSLMIFTLLGEYNFPAASAVALVILSFSLLFLLLIQLLQAYYSKRYKTI